MNEPVVAIVIAVITVAGGLIAAWAALRKSGPEAEKASAEAVDLVVGSAAKVVTMLRDQMTEMRQRLSDTEARLEAGEDRIDHLEAAVESWEGWADRILAVLDKAMGALSEEQRTALIEEVERLRRTRPARLSGS